MQDRTSTNGCRCFYLSDRSTTNRFVRSQWTIDGFRKDSRRLQESFAVSVQSIDTHTYDRQIEMKGRSNNRFDRQRHPDASTDCPAVRTRAPLADLPSDWVSIARRNKPRRSNVQSWNELSHLPDEPIHSLELESHIDCSRDG